MIESDGHDVEVVRTIAFEGVTIEEIVLDGEPGYFQIRRPDGSLIPSDRYEGGPENPGPACCVSLAHAQLLTRRHATDNERGTT